jgi:hypothetical protein
MDALAGLDNSHHASDELVHTWCQWVTARVRLPVCRHARSALGSLDVDTLLDAASHGPAGRWHLRPFAAASDWRPGGRMPDIASEPEGRRVRVTAAIRVRPGRLLFCHGGTTVMVLRAWATRMARARQDPSHMAGPARPVVVKSLTFLSSSYHGSNGSLSLGSLRPGVQV